MRDHAAEEDGVEPGEGAAEARDQAPADGEEGVAGVVQLARLAVPAIHKEAVAGGGGDLLRVLNGLPRDLGERVALGVGAPLHGPEAVFLAVAAIPNPVDEQVRDVQADQEGAVPAVLVGGVVGQVDDAVAVGERHARHVPEDEHEAPLLIVHVPGRDDELLALAACVGVEPVRHHEEHNLAGHVPVLLVLTYGVTDAKQQQDVPRQADLEEHLEVKNAKHARVKLSAHEEVVDGMTCHAVLGATVDGREIGDDGYKIPRQDRDGQQRAKIVDDGRDPVDTSEVQDGGDGQGGVQREEAGAVVLELLATLMGQRLSVCVNPRRIEVEDNLEGAKDPVSSPCPEVGERVGVDEVAEV